VKIARLRHLQEDILHEAYLAARRGTLPDPRVAEHLADCPACDRRYADLSAFMDDLSLSADADVDELFPAERRRVQTQRILHRLEHVGRPAKVLRFPGRTVARRITGAGQRIATRWIAAGAAAGLFIGVGLGLFLDFGGGRATPTTSMAAARPAPSVPPTPTRRQPPLFNSEADEDAFLSDLDLALDRPQTSVLRGYDALTPHVRDIVDIR
jgi:hypothetical protein